MNTALYLTRTLAISLILGGVTLIANQLIDYSNTQTEQIALVGTSISSKFNY